MSFRTALLTSAVLGLTGCDQPKLTTTAVAPQGKYQIVISPHTARDTFLLNTETGQVWQLTQFTFLNGEPVAWNAVPRIDNDDDYEKLVVDHGRKPR
jgi:hypothetical protein